MSAGPVTIACPSCGVAFPVPTELVMTEGHMVLARMDRSALHGHWQQCAAHKATPEPGKALERLPLAQPHDVPPFVARGNRPCVMCGAHADGCLSSLLAAPGTPPCCGACGEGNTHPAPGEAVPCSVWAAERAR